MGKRIPMYQNKKKGTLLFQFLKKCFHSLIIGYFQNNSRTKRGERESRKMKWHRRGGKRKERIVER
jgi:hypothetical protein